MAVCALTMLEGLESEVTAAGGVLLVVLALMLAWLSTHVADRGEHFLGTIMTVGTHTSLIGLAGHSSYSGGSQRADASEQQAPSSSQEDKPDEPGAEREGEGDGTGEDPEGVRPDLLLDIQSKQAQTERLFEEEEEEEEDDDDEDFDEESKNSKKHMPLTSSDASTTSMSVRLKFLNDTEETAVVQPQDTVESLKSRYFSGRERQIKLIYQGQLLHDPSRTLGSLNITHNSVIHCHISQVLLENNADDGAQSGGMGGGVQAAAAGTSSLVVPVFVVILAVVWYFRINYRQFFTAPATISLVGVTVFFSFLLFGMHGR
ncbi:transmembrane and ubiquitin-like domain-containing protein 2 [Synchiropus splendidus]|uniref:transmembrane and ubiquitin-like domain-containing protein 2 n=1 Tax=Synchiropus splendidus TaxID=270530 RepID=UPI00237DE978|nr:transmembrane and ubiquitin-like domain-containing protein 2 [Synchiropus splendidus]